MSVLVQTHSEGWEETIEGRDIAVEDGCLIVLGHDPNRGRHRAVCAYAAGTWLYAEVNE